MPAVLPHSVKQVEILHHHTFITLTRPFRETLHQLYIPLRHLIKTYIRTFHKKLYGSMSYLHIYTQERISIY